MRRLLRWAIPAILLCGVAFLARGSSTGIALDRTARSYLDALGQDDGASACSLLTDSLRRIVSPGFLEGLAGAPPDVSILAGRVEDRGRAMSLPLPGGGSRTIWMVRGTEGGWRVSGDTSLDNLLGSAAIRCTSLARSTVLPAVAAGASPGDFACPVSGLPYEVVEGRLTCPSGHLGDGMEVSGDACGTHRAEVATEVSAFMAAGHPRPLTLPEMYEQSDGAFGQPGGYRCPDHGYSYYEMTAEGVRCPFHEAVSPIPLPPAEPSAGAGL